MGNIQPSRKYLLLLLSLIVLSFFCFSQVTEQWVNKYNGPASGGDAARDLAVDAQGNVYVTGNVLVSIGGTFDYVTIKYDAAGNQLWVKRYNGPGNSQDGANAIAVDAQGNIYVTGGSADSDGYPDYATIKYDTNGNELWVRRYNNGVATHMALDAQGYIYIIGGGVIKYDADGNELWVKEYIGPEGSSTVANDLAVDTQGNVYVTGYAPNGSFYDYITIKYDTNGNELWFKMYDGPANEYSGDEAISIAVDIQGNVYVTGKSLNSEGYYDYVTIKYDADGNELWVKTYDGPDNLSDDATSIAVDSQGNVYVTGRSEGSTNSNAIATVKYDTNGNELWVRRNDGIGILHPNWAKELIAVDAQGNIYVTGEGVGSNSSSVYATVKYDTNGNELWVKRNDQIPYSSVYPTDLVVDAPGNVYITGSYQENPEGSDLDFLTIKNTQVKSSPLQVNAGADQTLYLGYGPNCFTLSAQATEGTTPYRYKWSPGDATISSIRVCPTTTTTYTVIVTDAAGQSANDEVKVKVVDVRCGNKGDKVLVCHKGKTLCIASSAVEAHLKHGDQLGSCPTTPALNGITENQDASEMIEEWPKRFQVSVIPNPFTTTTRLQYVLPTNGTVSIRVYDVVGSEVATVVQAEQKAGLYSADLNAANLVKGVYYYRALLTTKQKICTQTGKLLVVK